MQMAIIDIKVPDIGYFTDIPVIELLVIPGDVIRKEAGLVTLESDKATMEVPSTHAGTVKELRVKLGDMVYLSGELVITAGLPTHQRMLEYVDAGKPLPIDLYGMVLLQFGGYSPAPRRIGWSMSWRSG